MLSLGVDLSQDSDTTPRGTALNQRTTAAHSVLLLVFPVWDAVHFCLPGPSDVHTILHTSGTTGLPKGLLACHSSSRSYQFHVFHRSTLAHCSAAVCGSTNVESDVSSQNSKVWSTAMSFGRRTCLCPSSAEQIFAKSWG